MRIHNFRLYYETSNGNILDFFKDELIANLRCGPRKYLHGTTGWCPVTEGSCRKFVEMDQYGEASMTSHNIWDSWAASWRSVEGVVHAENLGEKSEVVLKFTENSRHLPPI